MILQLILLLLILFSDRSWIYQTCTEFGFYQTTDSDRQLFGNGFPLKWFTQQCQDIYGSQFSAAINSRAVKMTNTDYGGQQPKVTKVVFPNGSIDPWHVLGVTDDLGATAIAVYINGMWEMSSLSSFLICIKAGAIIILLYYYYIIVLLYDNHRKCLIWSVIKFNYQCKIHKGV